MARSRPAGRNSRSRTSVPQTNNFHTTHFTSADPAPSTQKARSHFSAQKSTSRPANTRNAAPSPVIPSSSRKRKARSQNAFAIASEQAAGSEKVRKGRLGEVDDGGDAEPRSKRRRLGMDEDEDDDKPGDGVGLDDQIEDMDAGKKWHVGVGSDDEDDEVDSDEAFGSGDEEKFEGYTFRGSWGGTKQRRGAGRTRAGSLDLSEGEEVGEENGDSMGSDAVDLADMLDDEEGPAAKTSKTKTKDKGRHSSPPSEGDLDGISQKSGPDDDFGGFDDEVDSGLNLEELLQGGSSNEDDVSDDSDSEPESDDDDPEKLERLNDIVASLPQPEPKGQATDNGESEDGPSDASRMIAALKDMPNLNPAFRSSLKTLTRHTDSSGKAKGSDRPKDLVQVPLPKRQKDKLDRTAAYKKAKETLNRWIDTVKHNRRADHLIFPLKDPHTQEAEGTTRMVQPRLSSKNDKPQNDLESAIQSILQQSGLAGPGGKTEEQQVREAEELESNKMPLEDVLAKRAELRKARDLLFREEQRAKRIKKIKSKAYRRVHRKERERNAQKERDLMAAAGLEMSDEEREKVDRRRAEERMETRHRDSKWAKSVKQTGRVAWDEEARSDVTEMAKRNEELRKRMGGEKLRGEDDEDSQGESDSDSIDEGDEETMRNKLLTELDKSGSASSPEGPGSRLMSMGFMQRAEAQRKKENDEAAEAAQHDLFGEESASESEPQAEIGRRSFGPTKATTDNALQATRKQKKNEFEEGTDSENEVDGPGTQFFRERDSGQNNTRPVVESGSNTPSNSKTKESNKEQGSQRVDSSYHGVTRPGAKSVTSHARDHTEEKNAKSIPLASSGTHVAKQPIPPSNPSNWTIVPAPQTNSNQTEDGDEEDENTSNNGEAGIFLAPSNEELVRAAFARGDEEDAADNFEREKHEAAESEDDQYEDTVLPGWGTWTGAGIPDKRKNSKKQGKQQKEQQRQQKFLKKSAEGVAPNHRKDAKLPNVILSEKRVRKNAKYLASTLPHPFENRQQYERSLRIPMGPEWTTKESFQANTKPRVIVKQGIVKPMEKPLL